MLTTDTHKNTNYLIEAEVTTAIKGGHRLKVSFLDLEMYIDGWVLRPSEKNEDGWWLQPPAIKIGHKWRVVVEFAHDNSFWKEIKQRCLEAVQEYERTEQPQDEIKELTVEDLDRAMKQFGIEESSGSGVEAPSLEDL